VIIVEKIHMSNGLALEELEAQRLDLLPDREEFFLPSSINNSFGGGNQSQHASNWLNQNANANAVGGSNATAFNAGVQGIEQYQARGN
jgi:hypothetical protein